MIKITSHILPYNFLLDEYNLIHFSLKGSFFYHFLNILKNNAYCTKFTSNLRNYIKNYQQFSHSSYTIYTIHNLDDCIIIICTHIKFNLLRFFLHKLSKEYAAINFANLLINIYILFTYLKLNSISCIILLKFFVENSNLITI